MTARSSLSISSAFDFLNDPVYAGDGIEKFDDADGIACIVRKSVSDTQLLQSRKKVAEDACVPAKQEIGLIAVPVPEVAEKKESRDSGYLTFNNAVPPVIENSFVSQHEIRTEELQKGCDLISSVGEGEINLRSESFSKPPTINGIENLFTPKYDEQEKSVELKNDLDILSFVAEGEEHGSLINENCEKSLPCHTENSNVGFIIQENYEKREIQNDSEESSSITSDMKVDNYYEHQNRFFANNTEDALLNSSPNTNVIMKHKICDTDSKIDKNANLKMDSSKLADQNHENESEVRMRNLPRYSERRSRRTEQIVSDAFHFLKSEDDDYCESKDMNSNGTLHLGSTFNSMPEKETVSSLPNESTCITDEHKDKLDHTMQRSNAFDEQMFDAVDGSQESVTKIISDKLLSSENACVGDNQNKCSSSDLNHNDDVTSITDHISREDQSADVLVVNFQEEGGDETDMKTNEDLSLCIDTQQNLCSKKIDLPKVENLKSELSQGSCESLTEAHTGKEKAKIILRKRRKKKGKAETDEHSDSSSDDDTRDIYNASTRNSCWLRVDENGALTMPSEELTFATRLSEYSASVSHQSSIDSMQPADDDAESNIARKDSTADDVFADSCPSPSFSSSHKRSDSTTTTMSEKDFKQEMNKYNSIRKCFVKRHNSQQEYQRYSARFYDLEKSVFIEKKSDDGDIGLHILDTHPATITSVDPGSPAEKAGIQEGQILVSVNGVSVLELSHSEIIKLVQLYPRFLRLEVGFSNISVVRDLQVPMLCGIMFKQSTSGLIKTWKKRYFVLRQDNCLYYYKHQNELDPLGAIPLCNYSVSRFIDTNKQYCFKAEKYGARTYYFMSESREEMTKWVGALNAASARTRNRTDSWMDVTSHNVGLPALEIRKPECTGFLSKLGRGTRTWRKRYCVLKDACIYYYKTMNAYSAQGVAHLHGYTVEGSGIQGKKHSFTLHPPEKQMRTFFFCVDNQTDKERWMAAMTMSIQRWVRVEADVDDKTVNVTV